MVCIPQRARMHTTHVRDAYQSAERIAYMRRMATRPKQRTKSSYQVAVRLPLALYESLARRPVPIARQIIEDVERCERERSESGLDPCAKSR